MYLLLHGGRVRSGRLEAAYCVSCVEVGHRTMTTGQVVVAAGGITASPPVGRPAPGLLPYVVDSLKF